ncbi:Hypothetical protein LUCI_1286 [Lucifera butyrica]|uniref:Organic solvent tolerance-like N-terminal domain-containing protein n=1 Tax=Lucifera butyrica TaxID=1351585 RepID=A0A498R3S7_9FIRM|nr:LptA/OstA family protein [Lucifera butyrica]VBB06071.1 Hypothetical protein LUCI_1286 [Lucifera butyrica]
MKRRIFLLVIFLLVLLTTTGFAAKPVIRADNTYFDINTGLYVLNGNVYIQVNNRIITAGQAKVNVAGLEVWGSGGVTVTQDDINFTGDSVYVYGAQDQAKIDGGVKLTRTGLTITADQVDFNWQNKIAVFSGHVQVSQNGNAYSADSVNYNVATNTIL